MRILKFILNCIFSYFRNIYIKLSIFFILRNFIILKIFFNKRIRFFIIKKIINIKLILYINNTILHLNIKIIFILLIILHFRFKNTAHFLLNLKNNFVIENFFPRNSFLWVYNQHSLNEIFQLRINNRVIWEIQFLGFNIF